MAKSDLHVHSQYSKRPSEWFLKRIGAQESYTSIEDLYEVAKSRQMDFVTISDHNTIDGALKLVEIHPEDCFVSVEVTTYFPEDQCKIHLLVFDCTPKQFAVIDKIRSNIYELRDYIKEENLAHSVAHATYNMNSKITIETLEKLILLFDIFEGLNGARNRNFSEVLAQTLQQLTPEILHDLEQKYKIKPFSKDPWIKGITGGSDDHSGLFIATTFTSSAVRTKEEFIQSLKDKRTSCGGRTNDYKSFAFSIYKIAYDFTKQKTNSSSKGLWEFINSFLFEEKRLNLKNRVMLGKLKGSKKNELMISFLSSLMKDLVNNKNMPFDQKIDRIYHNISMLFDQYCMKMIESFSKDLKKGDPVKILRDISAVIPVFFLSAPFFSSLKHLSSNRQILDDLKAKYLSHTESSEKKVLWFSDTICDLNGVSITLRDLTRRAQEEGRRFKLVVSDPRADDLKEIAPSLINLPPIFSFTPNFYQSYTMQFPSLLKAIERINEESPDEIIVSTPGFVGMLGFLVARLLGIKCTGIYHTDFTKQIDMILKDETLSHSVEGYIRWVYSLFDEIRVPTKQYIHDLSDRGYDPKMMKVFKRGVDVSIFNHEKNYTPIAQRKKDASQDKFMLVWSGRVSKDKNLEFLFLLYEDLYVRNPNITLTIIGDGPALASYKKQMKDYPNVLFLGKLTHEELPQWYANADLFIFPSTMDTFGMSVLEAQACGTPALVTNVGGPQEIVINGSTGRVIPLANFDRWVRAIEFFVKLKVRKPNTYERLRKRISHYYTHNFSLESSLNNMIGKKMVLEKKSLASSKHDRFFDRIDGTKKFVSGL